MAKVAFEKKILKTPGWNPETTVPIVQMDTVAEALAAGHYGSEADIMHAANATRRVRMDRLTRDALADRLESNTKGKTTGELTVEDLRSLLDGYTYKQREPGEGKGKPSGKVKALETKAAAASAVFAEVKLSPEQRAALKAAGYDIPEPAGKK